MNYQENEIPQLPKGIKQTILIVIVAIALLIAVLKMSITINGGEAGVLFKTFGGGIDVTKTYDEGFQIIAPWNKMVIYEVRQQQVMEKMSVLSSNGLEITIETSCWYQPVYAKLPNLYKEKGVDYVNRVVVPSIRSATRSVVGRYTPEEIYSTKRDAIQTEIFIESKKILEDEYVQLNQVLVRDITLPSTIKTAIENKLQQEQASLEYEFKLTKAKKEAERQKIDAQGKAEANLILSASLTDKILKEKGIEATLELARSSNAKVIVVGGTDGLPIILGNN